MGSGTPCRREPHEGGGPAALGDGSDESDDVREKVCWKWVDNPLPPELPFAFLPGFPSKVVTLITLVTLLAGEHPSLDGSRGGCGIPAHRGPATALADLKARREARPWFPGLGTCPSRRAKRSSSIRARPRAPARGEKNIQASVRSAFHFLRPRALPDINVSEALGGYGQEG